YGGSNSPPASARRLGELCHQGQTPLIKLPGIPVPPQHLVGTLAHLQFVGFPRVDGHLRPSLYYTQVLCEHCERRGDLEAGRYAAAWGERGCLLRLGCKGPSTHNSCSAVRWNSGSNWCVGAGGPCTGCAEPGFPDHDGLGLYGRLPGDLLGPRSLVLQSLDGLGKGLLGLTALGIGLHLLRRRLERAAPAHVPARQAADVSPAATPPKES
ncbi:MAG TPA: hypothetical protein VL359_06395, partial [bacterium]|nr:hypothetical protein [bacterium]